MKARLGQNFLTSPTAPHAIVAAAGAIRDRIVLEIGPGRGVITDLLLRAARRVVAIEFDRELAQNLIATYAPMGERVDVITNDVLRVDLTALGRREGGPMVVIGNLPYYITSQILLHLFQHAAAVDRAVLMVQREVADRLCAQPGTRDYGLLTVTAQLYATLERLFELTPQDFSPSPDVHSTVVSFNFSPRFAELQVEPETFLTFLRQCFAQKRKTITNNLRAAGYAPEQMDAAWRTTGISGSARAETLSLQRLAALFRALS